MMLNRNLKTSFNRVSEEYDRFRLDYPSGVFDYIISKTEIDSKSKILEIGAGSGIASVEFAKRGFPLTLIDPSEELLSIAKKKLSGYRNIEFLTGLFEDMELEPKSCDLIFAAQAFHWIDTAKGLKKVHQLLKDNSFFAVFWNLAQREKSELLQKIRSLYKKHCPNYHMGETKKIVSDLLDSGTFQNKESKSFERNISFSKEKYVQMIQTYSWVASLPEDKKISLLADLTKLLVQYQEPLEIPYETLLVVVQKQKQ